MNVVTWHGTQDEAASLLETVARHCACVFNSGAIVAPCAAHSALTDQRWLNGLLFMRRQRAQLWDQEMKLEPAPTV